MPKMDGYELTQAIRTEEKEGMRMPIIVLTANALKGEAERCRAVGMDDYRSKPLPLADLNALLQEWLPVTQSTQPASAPPDLLILPAQLVPEHAPANTGAPVNMSVLREMVGDDPDFVRTFVQDFRAKAIRTQGDLRAACHSREVKAVVSAAHNLKSLARTVGAFGLGDLCEALEQEGKAGDCDALNVLLPRFETEMVVVEDYLDRQ